MNQARVHSQCLLLLHTRVFFQKFGNDRDDVLASPVLDHVERLQRADDVLALDRSHAADFLDGDVAPILLQDLQQDRRPVRPEAQQPQVAQRLLRSPDLSFFLRQLVRS